MNDRELRRNAEGYPDPTAYQAIKNIDREDENFHKLLHTIFNVCELSGFRIEGRIVLVDEVTGKIWR
ncbi:MAG: hypothetical protein PHU69_02830 [Fermentimonas sp.]|nr:hypothetical protein [Fermentimonas sp.]